MKLLKRGIRTKILIWFRRKFGDIISTIGDVVIDLYATETDPNIYSKYYDVIVFLFGFIVLYNLKVK